MGIRNVGRYSGESRAGGWLGYPGRNSVVVGLSEGTAGSIRAEICICVPVEVWNN